MKDSHILRVSSLAVDYPRSGTQAPLRVVDDVTFNIRRGEFVGLIGESGSGKSTLARALMALHPSIGDIELRGESMPRHDQRKLRSWRQHIQLIPQDTLQSLDPRLTVVESVSEPLLSMQKEVRPTQNEVRVRVESNLRRVGLPAEVDHRYPHQLSGGQRQRVNIARALVLEPDLLICDEPVASLDVSVQAGIINLFMRLKSELDLSCLFISHDLDVIEYVSDRILVMYLGKIVEESWAAAAPAHPYTNALQRSRPRLGQRERIDVLEGEIPSFASIPAGCRFSTRCPRRQDLCLTMEPDLAPKDGLLIGHTVACHFPLSEEGSHFTGAEPLSQ